MPPKAAWCGQPQAFRLRYAGPVADVLSSVGLRLTGIEPLPDELAPATWTVLLGRPGNAPQVLRRQQPWLATRQWLVRHMPEVLAAGAAARCGSGGHGRPHR